MLFFILNLEKNILFLQENDDGSIYGTPGYMDPTAFTSKVSDINLKYAIYTINTIYILCNTHTYITIICLQFHTSTEF